MDPCEPPSAAAHEWAETPLGPVETWSPSLRTAAGIALACEFPMIVLWGEELIQIYNDGYREIMGTKHPGGLGQPTRECWHHLTSRSPAPLHGWREPQTHHAGRGKAT